MSLSSLFSFLSGVVRTARTTFGVPPSTTTRSSTPLALIHERFQPPLTHIFDLLRNHVPAEIETGALQMTPQLVNRHDGPAQDVREAGAGNERS